jgi:hypothetical protein
MKTNDYSKYPGHPLYGVPMKVLEAARNAYEAAFLDGSTQSGEMIQPVADAVLAAGLQEWDRTPIGDDTKPAPEPRASGWITVHIGGQVLNSGTMMNGPLDLDSQSDRLMLRAMLWSWLTREDDPDDV